MADCPRTCYNAAPPSEAFFMRDISQFPELD